MKPEHCIYCQGKAVSWRGFRLRTASALVDDGEGSEVVYHHDIANRRVKCATAGCGRSWTLRPPGIFPRRHYQLCVVAAATSQYLHQGQASQEAVAAAYGCSRRSLGRWLTWESQIAKPSDLQRHILDVAEAPLLVKTQPVGNLARMAVAASHRQILAAAAMVLGLLEMLAAALGYEPPGLRSVLETVVGNRDRVTTLAAPAVPELARRRLFWPVAVCAM
jgi:hypothetical protein